MMNLSHPNLSAIIKRVYAEVIRPQLAHYLSVLLSYLEKIVLIALFIVPALVLVILAAGWFTVIKVILSVISFIALALFMFLVVSFGSSRKRELWVLKSEDRLLAGVKEKMSNVMNLLAVMETDIGDCFIQMEEELRKNIRGIESNNGLVLSGSGDRKVYDRIVLTPLVMDFGLKEDGLSSLPYKVRWKPVVAQIEDLCIGIRDYYLYRDNYIRPTGHAATPLFRIYPFMGINTRNYDMKGMVGSGAISVLLEDLLERNFKKFGDDKTPEMRRASLEAVPWSAFDGSISSIGSHYFMGIKVYPPLGFDPWPDDEKEMKKVRYLYQFCVDNNVPVTSHCSPGGFLVNNEYRDFSSPFKWESVLKNYPDLRLNLAHFGGEEKPEWRDKILELIVEHDYEHFYTDISYQGVHKNSYASLRKIFDRYHSQQRKRLSEHVIFGTDFMINLQDIKSYSQYLQYFIDADTFTSEEKDLMCHINTERFLYVG